MAPTTLPCKELGVIIARSFHHQGLGYIDSWSELQKGLKLRASDADKEAIELLMKKPNEPQGGGFDRLMAIHKGGSTQALLDRSREALDCLVDNKSDEQLEVEWKTAKSAGLWKTHGGITKACDLAVFRRAAAGQLGRTLTGAQMAAFKAVWAVEVPNMPDKQAGRQISKACGKARGFQRVNK